MKNDNRQICDYCGSLEEPEFLTGVDLDSIQCLVVRVTEHVELCPRCMRKLTLKRQHTDAEFLKDLRKRKTTRERKEKRKKQKNAMSIREYEKQYYKAYDEAPNR